MQNSSDQPLVLGISASHNGSACLLRGNDILVAIQEERLTRVKRKKIWAGEPCLSVTYCLNSAGVSMSEVDLIVVCVQGSTKGRRHQASLNPQLKEKRAEVDIIYVSHHLCHAISAYATSGYSSSDILVIDGVGSPREDLGESERILAPQGQNLWESLSCYQASGIDIKPLMKHMRREPSSKRLSQSKGLKSKLKSVSKNLLNRAHHQASDWPSSIYPKPFTVESLGSMFEAVSLIIFGKRMQAGKVMGLAAYGKATIPVDEFLQWSNGKITYTNRFISRFTEHSPWPANAQEHQDLACSVQHALEYAVLKQVGFLRRRTNGTTLCYAGGVALNTLLNERIIRESGYENVYIVPAAEDSGTALGAAYFGMWRLGGEFFTKAMQADNLGHHYSNTLISSSLSSLPGIQLLHCEETELLDNVINRLCDGQVGGWFQGGSELGPRALGQRSMLCDARSTTAKNFLNNEVKNRESFRPFAPVVLAEHAADWFDFEGTEATSPFMLRVANVLPHALDKVPAIIHIDGTARVQTVTPENGLLYPLLQAFYKRTGVPILLNTSLNVAGEPIVETPEDAWRCLQTTVLDFCMLDTVLAIKINPDKTLLDFTPVTTFKRYEIIREPNGPEGLDTKARVSIWTDTPWGELKSSISIPQLSLLKAIDGKRSGVEIARELRPNIASATQRLNMMQELQSLHQCYAIRFI